MKLEVSVWESSERKGFYFINVNGIIVNADKAVELDGIHTIIGTCLAAKYGRWFTSEETQACNIAYGEFSNNRAYRMFSRKFVKSGF